MGAKARRYTPAMVPSLDDLVPTDQYYRHRDRVLDHTVVRDLMHSCYAADKGCPAVDLDVRCRLQVIMCFKGIGSERQLLRLAVDQLSVRWYLGNNPDEALPDHSILTRRCYGVEVLRWFFEAIVAHCRQAGPAWGRDRCFDSTPPGSGRMPHSIRLSPALPSTLATRGRLNRPGRVTRVAETKRSGKQSTDPSTPWRHAWRRSLTGMTRMLLPLPRPRYRQYQPG
jgi:transposase